MSPEDAGSVDKFVAMVSAKSEVNLRASVSTPRGSELARFLHILLSGRDFQSSITITISIRVFRTTYCGVWTPAVSR